MKSVLRVLIFNISIVLINLFFGCSTVQTLYLQEIEVSGPINQPPIHLTDKSKKKSVTITPRISFNTQKKLNGSAEGHSHVNEEGIFQMDTSFFNDGSVKYTETPGVNVFLFEGKNLTWNQSGFTVAIDFDFTLNKNLADFTGVNYSSDENGRLWGGTAVYEKHCC